MGHHILHDTSQKNRSPSIINLGVGQTIYSLNMGLLKDKLPKKKMLISHHHFPIERPSLDVSTIFQIIYCWFVVSRERSLLCHISTGYNADTC